MFLCTLPKSIEMQPKRISAHNMHNNKIHEAEKHFKKGINLLKKQKPREAIPSLNMALKLNPSFEEAKLALKDAVEGSKWNTRHFCRKCGKLITPKRGYPLVEIEGFCPTCGQSTPAIKEEIISHIELVVKLISFGIFPIVVFIFCGMPNWQHIYPYRAGYAWNTLAGGIIRAAQFTPIVILFLIVINDPLAFSISEPLDYLFGPLVDSPLYLFAAFSFLFLIVYLYFLLLLTPIVTIHKKGLWRSKKHQKNILLYTSIFVGLIATIRIASGVLN